MLVRELILVLESTHHGFTIEGPVPRNAETPALPVNTLAGWWPDQQPDLSGFIIYTGSQWGPVGVVVRLLDRDPGPADLRWQDVVEASVDINGPVLVGDIADGPAGDLSCPKGTYRMRVAALGRTESAARDFNFDEDEDGDTEDDPLEHYLLELWPAAAQPSLVVREESQYAKDQKNPPEPDGPAEGEPGLAAAWALVRDVRSEPGGRQLPGELDTLTLSMELPLSKTKLFNRLRYAAGWPPCRGGGGSADPAVDYYDATLPEYGDRYEQAGSIVVTVVQADKPNSVVRRWNWITASRGPLDGAPRLLLTDSTVTLTFTDISSDGHDPRTLVQLTHEGIPEAWVADLKALWAWDLVHRARL